LAYAKIVEVFRTLHTALGRWYWFLFITLSLITVHTIDHTSAVFIDRGPLASSFISDDNVEGFVLWHGGLTAADYTMTIVLLTLLYRRSLSGGPGTRPSVGLLTKGRFVLSRLHQVMGKWYWFLFVALIPITVHTADHIIFMILNGSPLSDTIVADSFSHEGFLIWHSGLTILDYMLTVLLLSMIYRQWAAAHTSPVAGPPSRTITA